MALCPGCGNEIADPEHCPVCMAGRATPKAGKRKKGNACMCPRCAVALVPQDWEGVATLSCPSCRGTLFPDRGLESVLNKLRATCDPVDVASAFREFKDRFKRELPDAVRYKDCPVCETPMMRRNYATVSGVVVDQCADHGTWVDETAFAALADFICRGGDVLANETGKFRARLDAKQAERSRSLANKFFGTGS